LHDKHGGTNLVKCFAFTNIDIAFQPSLRGRGVNITFAQYGYFSVSMLNTVSLYGIHII